MARKESYIVGLDIGSNKTCALVSQPGQNGKLEVAGLGVVDSKGWRKGVIVNLDFVGSAIKKAVEEAEATAGVPVDSAYVGVGGAHIKGVNSSGAISLDKSASAAREVTREDILKVIQAAQSIALPPDRTLLHVMRQQYLVDSQNGIRDPVGMLGRRLEADVHLITASATGTQNVVTAVNRAGIVVQDTVYEPLASAEACLTLDERELGVALVDIGAGSTDMIVYHQGTVRHTASVPVGGDHFTNDIAVGLRTPIPEAEKMKRAWGQRESEKPYDTVLEAAGVGERPSRAVSYAMLGEIIVPRTIELIELVQAELARSGFEKQLGAGMVLTGGGAKLGGLVGLAERTLAFPVRVGRSAGLKNMGEVLPDPAFATLVGLVTYGNRHRLLRDSRDKGLAGRLWGFLQGGKDH
jgi:cell division protein FtsA